MLEATVGKNQSDLLVQETAGVGLFSQALIAEATALSLMESSDIENISGIACR